jgi:hypothetical protein
MLFIGEIQWKMKMINPRNLFSSPMLPQEIKIKIDI